MTSTNHQITSIAFGVMVSALALNGTLSHPYNYDTIYVIGLWISGIVVGASAPDYLEFSSQIKGKRFSLIPHRTLTHWPPIWLLAAYIVHQAQLPWFVEIFAYAFIASSLVHLAMDMLSKSGIPILLPFSAFRMKIPLYSTGKFSEAVAATAILILFVMSFQIIQYL